MKGVGNKPVNGRGVTRNRDPKTMGAVYFTTI